MQQSAQLVNHRELLILLNQSIYMNKSCSEMQQSLNESTFQQFFKYMMKNPVNLEIQDLIQYFPWVKCVVQAKASGLRCLLVIYQGVVYLLFEAKLEQIGTSPLQNLSVFECELMPEEKGHQTLLCYDQHMFENKPVFQQNYFFRIWKLRQELDSLVQVSQLNEKYLLKAKQFEQIKHAMSPKELKKVMKRIYSSQFQNDGLIINTNSPLQYQRIFKWKPADQLTIDFKCAVSPSNPKIYTLNAFDPSQNASVPFTSPIIECSNIFQATPKTPSLDNKVVEFNYDVKHDRWVLVRIREDKGKNGKGNSLKVARSVMASIIYNIDFDLLCTGTGEVYFEHKKFNNYKAMTRFINEVKQSQIQGVRELLRGKNIENPVALDLGSGKGQDILKFQDYSTVVCVDNDKYALWELNHRTSALKTNTKVKTVHANLADWEALNLLPTQVDFLNCNLALHYFIDNLSYIIETSNPLIVNIMIFDGSKVNSEQTIYENNEVKYHYHVLKNDPSRIEIKLPFRNQLTEETIVFPQQIIETLEKFKYKVDKYQSLSEFQFQVQGLTEADKQHIANYSILQFSRQ